jgi:hypothetical protein
MGCLVVVAFNAGIPAFAIREYWQQFCGKNPLDSGSVERQSRMLESSVPAINLHNSGIKVV